MNRPPTHHQDPLGWTMLLVAGFMLLCLVRLTIPTKLYFDEIHYVPAARALLEQSKWLNREHPMLGKEILAAGIALFGDRPIGWRIFPLLAGGAGLFAFCRAMWFASLSRFASLATGLLIATGFALFVHARIAMLDIFMVSFFAIALWQLAGAVREPETGRRRLALAGIAMGLSMASKWNTVPLAMLPGLTFLAARALAGRRRLFFSRRGDPVPGITLVEAALWLGIVPLAVYWMTYLPAHFFTQNPLHFGHFIALHQDMLALQQSVVKPHPYQSTWATWIINDRAIWYLYEPVNGAQRGIVLIGNPLTMLIGLPALLWCAWVGIWHHRRDALAVFILYAVSIGFWAIAAKPIQFYYHYFLSSCFLLGALALALDDLWQRGRKALPLLVLGGSTAIFIWFYPIISAAPLAGRMSFMHWMWLNGWR